jgi:hypothetical protein
MLEISQAQILKLAITWSGNKERSEGVVIPKSTLVPLNDYAHEVLLATFLKPFEKSEEFFYFFHPDDVSQNRVYQACFNIFQNPETLSEEAAKLTEQFYMLSASPKIMGGEFFVALINDLIMQGEAMPAIGIFKVVGKNPYLKVDRSTEAFTLQIGEGISTGKMALAALILGADELEGYRVLTVDALTKKDETSIWTQQFLEVLPIEDNYYHTRHYMQLANTFIREKAPHKFGLERADTIDLLNRSSFYFKENEHFEIDDFAEKLFEEPTQQADFKAFKEEYAQETTLPLDDKFDISKQAVRKSGKVFKNVIKLDENFQIYVQGRRDLIERGFDEDKGKPFYKIYFDRED